MGQPVLEEQQTKPSPARALWERRPFWLRKLGQLWRLVRESHERPMAGEPRLPTAAPAGQIGATFLGHSSFLLEIPIANGSRHLLVDPVFATRLVVLRRQRRPGIRLRDLPQIDAVLLTHAHMDHLNLPTLRGVVREMRRRGLPAPEVVVPQGVADLVRRVGFRSITELEWWQSTSLETTPGTQPPIVTLTPCKHWGARMFRDTHRGYGGYVIASAGRSIYHAGDTAYFRGFREIGERLHPELALLPIGAYFPDSYRAVHTSPEEALRGFLEVGAKRMIPMHFGTFRLGREPMEEPPLRLLAEASRLGVADRVQVLNEGETLLA